MARPPSTPGQFPTYLRYDWRPSSRYPLVNSNVTPWKKKSGKVTFGALRESLQSTAFRRGSAPFCETVGVRMRCLTTGMAWPGWLGPCHVEAPHCQHKCLSPVGSGSAGRHLSPRPPLPSLPAAMDNSRAGRLKRGLGKGARSRSLGLLALPGSQGRGCLLRVKESRCPPVALQCPVGYRWPDLPRTPELYQRIEDTIGVPVASSSFNGNVRTMKMTR